VFLASKRTRFTLPGGCNDPIALKELGLRAWTANSHWPVSRAVELQGTSAAYGAFLAPDAFAADAAFFGISRTEARAMDPMAMLVLETTYGALSSDSRSELANKPVGFFLGSCGWTGGQENASKVPKAASVYSGTSGALSVLSGRLSYTLGLTGPCQTTDTACSSSLVAAHQAVSALKLGESPAAAVAGVGMLTVAVSVAFSAAGMLSALGRCHTFDRRADGYCRGEGCGAFYFSTEADDVAVSGTAVQQDGPSASLTAPNGSSQQRLIEAVRSGHGPSLEAHGTGTALGDPIEVGAATRALRKPTGNGNTAIQCTSLKSNVGHLEPAAAAAGLASLVVGPLMASVVAANAQLRGLNAHLSSIVSSKPFQMPVEVIPRTTASSGSRLSSFGFSGTIAHGAFEVRKPATSPMDTKSLYRNRRDVLSSDTTRLDWLLEAPGPQPSRLDEAVVFSGALSPSAEALFSHHVVGGAIILPGVGYVEMAFATSSGRALEAVVFLRPCVLPEPGRGEKCVLRCTRRSDTLEIASARGTGSSSFASCFAGTLANIESSDHTEPISGRGFKAHTGRSVEALSLHNSVVPVAILGPRPRLLEVSSRIGGTAWTFSARKSLRSVNRQLSRSRNQACNASKCTHLHLGRRWQSCTSLRGTVLSKSRVLASHAHNNK
jgi:3-oxoacyl-(acyl-carrier-protein) synthase